MAPEHRRRGLGRALLAHLQAEAIRQGRTRLIGSVQQPLDPGEPDPAGNFAAACAAVPVLVETRRRLDIGSVDPAVLARLDAQARSQSRDYSLVQWVGVTPQRWLDGVAYLTGRMSTDTPLDDLQWDAEVYDAARKQACEASWVARGLRMVTTGAVTNLHLAQAQCPELRVIETCNADSNPYMVSINAAMGFRPHRRTGQWQLDCSHSA